MEQQFHRYGRSVAAAMLIFGVACEPSEDTGVTPLPANMSAGSLSPSSQSMEPAGGSSSFDTPGPWPVGFRETEIEYNTPRGDVRRMRLLVWYPVVDVQMRPIEAAFVGGLYIREGVYVAGSPPDGQRFPLMVFSHGSQGLAEQSFFLTEHFASHGWIVVAPDHTGNTLYSAGGPLHRFNYVRPQDIHAVLDHMLTLPADDPLADHLNETAIIAGHSFGAYTALAIAGAVFDADQLDVCGDDRDIRALCVPDAADDFRRGFTDRRFTAAIAMTPIGLNAYLTGAGTLGNIATPTLIMTAGLDTVQPPEPHGERVWASLRRAPHMRLDFPNAGHFSFSNLCESVPRAVIPDRIYTDGCSPRLTPTSTVHDVAKALTLAFVRARLFNDPAAMRFMSDIDSLRGVATVYDGGSSEP
ncbi:MAG: hypothetical protein VX589_01125 [Myxococcota bacterium]|nr:hypothetical protein [Myxococcota bacterium]